MEISGINYQTTNSSGISLKVTGALWTMGVHTTSSNRRIKINISALVDGDSLNIINRLNPCKYEYIDNIRKGGHTVVSLFLKKRKK